MSASSAPGRQRGGRLAGKVCLIPGGAGGIGRAVAERCAAEGALVAIADIDNDSGAAAAAGLGDAALFVPMDVRDAASVEAGVEAVLRRFGRLDGLIQCAGASGRHHGDGPAADCAEAGWEWVIELNLRGVFLTCKYSLRAMLQGGGGAIVNVASVLGLVGVRDHFATHAYAAAKGGVIALTRSIAAYYARSHIRCNAVCPGLVRTPMARRALSDAAILAALEEYQPLLPVLEPRDVADACVYLISDESRAVTGVILPVDAGWSAQ